MTAIEQLQSTLNALGLTMAVRHLHGSDGPQQPADACALYRLPCRVVLYAATTIPIRRLTSSCMATAC